jgi:hypothetical protein
MRRHLQERHLDISLYNGIQVFNDVVIFPLWNLSGMWCGYQQYRPYADKKAKNDPRKGRYYTSVHGDKSQRPLSVWGLESYHLRDDVLVITEGIFDACRLHNIGIPSVALLTSSYKHSKNWLTSTGRKIYKVEDDHGSKLGPYTKLNLPNDKNDLGDCTNEEVVDVASFLL